MKSYNENLLCSYNKCFGEKIINPLFSLGSPYLYKGKKGPIFLSVTQLYGIFVQMCLDFFLKFNYNYIYIYIYIYLYIYWLVRGSTNKFWEC